MNPSIPPAPSPGTMALPPGTVVAAAIAAITSATPAGLRGVTGITRVRGVAGRAEPPPDPQAHARFEQAMATRETADAPVASASAPADTAEEPAPQLAALPTLGLPHGPVPAATPPGPQPGPAQRLPQGAQPTTTATTTTTTVPVIAALGDPAAEPSVPAPMEAPVAHPPVRAATQPAAMPTTPVPVPSAPLGSSVPDHAEHRADQADPQVNAVDVDDAPPMAEPLEPPPLQPSLPPLVPAPVITLAAAPAATPPATVPDTGPQLRERLVETVQQLMVGVAPTGAVEVRMVLRDDVLPGVTLVVQQAAAQLVVSFECSAQASRVRLDRGGAGLAQALARRLGRDVTVQVQGVLGVHGIALRFDAGPQDDEVTA